MKKIISVLAICLFCMSAFSGCMKKDPSQPMHLPVATQNPNITIPEGQYYTRADGTKVAEGALASLAGDYSYMKVMIEGQEVEFVLFGDLQDVVERNVHKLSKGSMLQIAYETKNLVNHATEINLLKAN